MPNLAGLKDFARQAEDGGYSVLLLPDHLNEQLSPFPALAAAAQVTRTLRFGTLTVANDLRHPTVLAKEASTVDVLTDGRLELGIGTGSMESDNRMSGIPLDPPGVRVERITETIRILKAFFTEKEVNFQGKHYQVQGLPTEPLPVQRPLPLLIGANGPRMLRLAAREADIISIMGPYDGIAERRNIIREAAGDRYGRIELNFLVPRIQIDGKPEMPPATRPGPMSGFIGSRDQIVEELLRLREETDVSYIAVGAMGMEAFAPIVAKLAGK